MRYISQEMPSRYYGHLEVDSGNWYDYQIVLQLSFNLCSMINTTLQFRHHNIIVHDYAIYDWNKNVKSLCFIVVVNSDRQF